jgi:hypothetical protein
MIDRFSKSEEEWLKELTVLASSQSLDSTLAGSLEDWASESIWCARSAYQDPLTGKRIKSGTKLGEEYHDANLPVARLRMAQAGVRLAMMLNDVFVAR